MDLLLLFSIFASLLLSGMLSLSETAITAMSTAKIHKLKTDGNKQAAIISKLREDKEGLISTILLANNACNILASTVATAALINIFGSEGVIYSTLIMTIVIIVFVEILPKTYAISNPERAALFLARFLQITVKVCVPCTKAINLFVYYILKIFKTESSNYLVSPTDEIKGAIELHHQEGAVDQSDKYMLDGVFYLGETRVGEVMTHRKNIQTINIDLPVREIALQIKAIGHTRIPLWKDSHDNIVGILNTRDFLLAMISQQDFDQIKIEKLITEPKFIHENTALDEQLAEFKASKTRFAIVIDEYGDIQGIITLADILEEVVGRFQDEHDNEKEEIISVQDNCCIVKGEMTVRDLNRMLNWNLPDEEASTIAGLLIFEAERIPEMGESLKVHGFNFTVLTKKLNQLTSIKIEKL